MSKMEEVRAYLKEVGGGREREREYGPERCPRRGLNILLLGAELPTKWYPPHRLATGHRISYDNCDMTPKRGSAIMFGIRWI